MIRVEHDVEINRDEGSTNDLTSPRRSNRDILAEDVARELERRL